MGASNKYISYDSVDDVVYYDLPTPFTELMYRSVFEQGDLPYDPSFEFPRERVRMIRVLGSGAFGEVNIGLFIIVNME